MNLSPTALDLLSSLLGADYEYLCQACTDSEEEIAQHEKALDELFSLLSKLRSHQ